MLRLLPTLFLAMFVPLLAFPQDFWLEAECATVGANWQVVSNTSASQGSYLATPVGNFSAAASADPANSAVFQFNVSQPGNYAVFARVIAPTTNDDSYWVRANGGNWVRWNLIQASTTFIWDQVHNDLNNSQPVLFALQAGMNTIEFGIRENGTSLDKIYVTLSGSTPSGIGNTASNCSGGAPLNISALPTQFHDEGDAVSLQVAAAGGDSTLHFSATGLPPGLTINNLSGEIAGVIAQGAQAGSAYFPVITVDDSDSTSLDAISTTFKWVIFEAGTGFTNNWIYLEPQISPKHISRHENSFVQAGDRFYLFGGRESPRVVEEFNYTTKSWSNANIQAPKDFNHFQPITYEGLVWLFCAFANNSFPNETPVDSVFVMDPAGKRWISWTSIPAARRRGSAGTVEYQGQFYIVCGNTIGHNGGYVSWFDRYDPATNTWTVLPNAPRARDHFQSAVIGDKLYLSGGRLSGGPGGTFAPTIPEIDVYDFTTGTWSTLPASSNLPTQRAGNASVNFKGQLVVIGGEANGQAWNSVEMMDPASGTWETLAPLNFARHGTQAVVAGDGIYITSGSPVQGGGKMTNMEVFSQDNPGMADPIDPSQLFALDTLRFSPTLPGDTAFATLRLWATNGNQGIMIEGISVQGASTVQATSSLSFPRLLKANDTLEIVYRYLPTNSNGLSGQIVIQQGPFGASISVPLALFSSVQQPIVLPAIANRSNTVGDVVSFQVPASGGDGALVFSANGLPAGLSISSSGLISGTVLASALASNSVTITVDDSDGTLADKQTATFTWTISPLPVPIVLPAIANRSNTVGDVVSFHVPASGGDGALVFSANGLPAGLSISSSGLISGTVLASALASNLVTITVDDSDAITSDKQTASLTWTISPLPVPIVLPAIVNRSNTVGDVVSFQVPASGGDGALVFSANGLPAGLSISSSGLISGTVLASALASNLVTITVDDSDAITSDKQTASLTWTISPLPVPIVLPAIVNRSNTVGDVVSFQVPASGGDGALVFSANGLPAGLSISSSGLISGTVLASALASNLVTITVDDSDAITSDKQTASLTWTISPLPVPIVLPAIANRSNTVGNVVSFQVPASGGDGALVFSANGLPAGLSISSSGLISGTVLASALASNSVTITVDDSDAITSDNKTTSFTWNISPLPVPIVLPAIANRSNTVGDVVSFQVPASGGDGPLVFSANGLPAGLSISSSGLISGTVLASALASNSVTITVDDSDAITSDKKTASFTWQIDSPPVPVFNNIWLEAECGVVGSNWSQHQSALASNGLYVTAPNTNFNNTPSPLAANQISYPFTVSTAGVYYLFGRVLVPNGNDDSFWVRIDGGSWIRWNDLPLSPQFQWVHVFNNLASNAQVSFALSGGSHTLEVAGRETGASVDKWFLSQQNLAPIEEGGTATNCLSPSVPIQALPVASQTSTEGDNVLLPLSISGGDGSISVTATGLPGGLAVAGSTIAGTLNAGTASQTPYQVILTIDDADSDPTDKIVLSFSWTVLPAPVPLSLTPVNDQENDEGDTVSIQLSASGGEGTLQFFASGLPAGLTLNPTSGEIAGVIATGAANGSPYPTLVWVDDSDGDQTDTAQVSFVWTVHEVVVPVVTDLWLEAECGIAGGNWSIVSSTLASGGQYALAPAVDFLNSASADPANHLRFQVTVSQTATYHLFGRVLSPTTNEDSYWVRVNGGAWIKWNEIAGSASLAWDHLHNNNLGNVEVQITLQAGTNEIVFAGRENGTGLDKLYLTTGTAVPAGSGGTAPGCEPVQPSVPILITGIPGQTNEEGNFVSLQVQASGGDGALVFSANGLPPGLSISGSGLIQGVIGGAANSPYLVTITADDSDGDLSDLQSILFAWTVELPVSEAWLEAECGDIGSAWAILPSPDASGGFYLKAPEQTFNNAPSTAAANLATFEANISTAGQYRLIGRVLAANSNDDSFWVRMNGGTWVRWNNIQLSNTFLWDEVHEDRTGNTVVVFTLSPGIQTIELAGRETGTLIDKLFLTREPGIPSGLGEEAVNCETVTSNAAEHGGQGGLEFGRSWEVFPNPLTSGATTLTLRFSTQVSGLHTLSLSDLQGRSIKAEETHWLRQQQELELKLDAPLAAGLYLIQLRDANGSTVKRILVQAGL